MRSRGFTLIEVLAALVIVALGMAAVLTTLGSSANTVAYLREKTLAQWIALNQIATTRLGSAMPGLGTSNGDVDYAGRSWHWRQKVTQAHVPGLYRIEVSVRRGTALHGRPATWLASETGVLASPSMVAPAKSTSLYGEYLAPSGTSAGTSSLGAP